MKQNIMHLKGCDIELYLINLMATSTETISTLAQSMKLSNCIQLNINSQFLEMNFQLIKKCLLKVDDLHQDFSKEKDSNKALLERISSIEQSVAGNRTLIDEQQKRIKDIQQNIGEDFLKKFEELEQKTRNTHDIQKLAKQLQELNRFMTIENFKEFQSKVNENLSQIDKVKSELDKYLEKGVFDQFKEQNSRELRQLEAAINALKNDHKLLEKQISSIDEKVMKACREVEQNNKMMKQINFNDMQQKLKKIKEDTDTKLSEFVIKLKKKVGISDLAENQKNIIEKIDRFLNGEKPKADKEETKEALTFLEKRINEIYEQFLTDENKEQNDPMFATKKWMCASCAKDLGKFEGKLNQFKPWSVFPCRQMDPEKTGGYGYLNYVDKMAYKRGFSIDDTNMERLNKTFYERNRDSPKKMNSTRTTNFMSNFGTADKHAISLKDEYFKVQEKGAKFFRVKKEMKRDTSEMEREKVKDI